MYVPNNFNCTISLFLLFREVTSRQVDVYRWDHLRFIYFTPDLVNLYLVLMGRFGRFSFDLFLTRVPTFD